jgi:O-antigen ligase
MAQSFWREWRTPVEFALLIGIAIFLPLREAPKNLLWLAYVVAWFVGRLKQRDFGGRPDAMDVLLAGVLISGVLAAAFAGIRRGDANEWHAISDILRYGSLFVLVRRAGYSKTQLVLLFMVLVASCALAEVEALWNWKVVSKRKALELFSVGHVNHSAIYLCICLGLAAGLLVGMWTNLSVRERTWIASMTLFMLIGLFLGGSRAAGAMGVLLILAAAVAATRSLQISKVVWAGALAVIALAALVGGTSALQRQIEWGSQNYTLAQRDLIWNRGLVAWREAPIFGVGMENYGHFDDAQLERWVQQQGRAYVKAEYAAAPHAHSLYINSLVERGVAGLAALLAFLGVAGWRLWNERPGFVGGGAAVTLWFGGVSAWLVTVLIGFANTTLHHEHAMLAMLALAAAITPPGRRAA